MIFSNLTFHKIYRLLCCRLFSFLFSKGLFTNFEYITFFLCPTERNIFYKRFRTQKSTFITIEATQEGFRARELLKVLSTESYRTDSRIGLGATDDEYPSPFPPPHSILRKAQISHMTNLHTSMVLSLVDPHASL